MLRWQSLDMVQIFFNSFKCVIESCSLPSWQCIIYPALQCIIMLRVESKKGTILPALLIIEEKQLCLCHKQQSINAYNKLIFHSNPYPELEICYFVLRSKFLKTNKPFCLVIMLKSWRRLCKRLQAQFQKVAQCRPVTVDFTTTPPTPL